MNRYRFQNESALLAAWKAAKHVVTGPQTEEEKGPLELGVGHLPGGTLVTTALVMAEMHGLVLRFRGPAAALRLLDGVAADPSHEVIDVDRDLRLAPIPRRLRPIAAIERLHPGVNLFAALPFVRAGRRP